MASIGCVSPTFTISIFSPPAIARDVLFERSPIKVGTICTVQLIFSNVIALSASSTFSISLFSANNPVS